MSENAIGLPEINEATAILPQKFPASKFPKL
jgi:hypothetical protein